MAIPKLSKELKKLRIDHDINRAEMAAELKMSDKDLANIETGKSAVTDSLLIAIANRYADPDEGAESLLAKLRMAHVESVQAVTFDLSSMSTDQRMRVMSLQSEIAEENAAALAAAKAEAERQREQKRAERAAKKAAALASVEPEPVPAPELETQNEEGPSVAKVSESLLSNEVDSDLSEEDLELLASLEDA